MFSSKSSQWETPQNIYDALNKEFRFTLDPCADESNHKCDKYYTEQDDGLQKDWTGETVFCNPPYSNVKEWVKKCFEESSHKGVLCVALVPARTDTKWFHQYIYPYCQNIRGQSDDKQTSYGMGKVIIEVRFVKGRLKFGDSKNSAPFPSMVVIFRPLL